MSILKLENRDQRIAAISVDICRKLCVEYGSASHLAVKAQVDRRLLDCIDPSVIWRALASNDAFVFSQHDRLFRISAV